MTDHTRDPLDQAIDQVAARLVSVEHDQAMPDRIVARLPERARQSAWLGALLPQAALATVLVAAVIMWMTREPDQVREPAVDVRRAEASASAVAPVVAAEAEAPALRTVDSQFVVTPDHERALVPVAAPMFLEVAGLAGPAALPAEPPVVLAPIVLTELPLSGESISPR